MAIPGQRDPLQPDAELFDRLLDAATRRLSAGEDYDTVIDWWRPRVAAVFDRAVERTAAALIGGAR